METNLLVAIANLIKGPVVDLESYYAGSNRVNNVGEALETYIKDLFCGTLREKDISKKDKSYSNNFSYIGNQNNPPDAMIKGGDAIEVKKIENFDSDIALNSSYPKDKLYANSTMITNDCRKAENWKEKDLVYAVGVAENGKLKSLWFVYGDCYAASRDIYEKIKSLITAGINKLPNIEFSKTVELGRVNRVDPLGITYLRVRGMWGIKNPAKVFSGVTPIDHGTGFSMNAIMLKSKYLSFPEKDRKFLEKFNNKRFILQDIKIKSPNNLAKLLDAKLISFKQIL
jgi:hypothetical protein